LTFGFHNRQATSAKGNPPLSEQARFQRIAQAKRLVYQERWLVLFALGGKYFALAALAPPPVGQPPKQESERHQVGEKVGLEKQV
jgi:hypothetical protein